MTPEQKQEMFSLIKNEVERNHGVSMTHLIEKKYGIIKDESVFLNMKSLLESSGNFLVIKVPEVGYYVTQDPNYQLSKSVKETNRIQKVTLCLTIGISLFTSAIAWLTYKKKEAPIINLISPTTKTDTLRLHTTQKDSFLLYTK